MNDIKLESGWKKALAPVWTTEQWAQLARFVRSEYATATVYPPASRIFTAMDSCPFSEVKVVILGQDPYHGPGQANGLSFSVAEGVALPPSLLNIFKDVKADVGSPIPQSGNLERWARQGVLLLNSALTVRAHEPASHSRAGWWLLTDAAISALSQRRSNVVFMLWGAHAGRKAELIDSQRHLVLQAPHPSPLSASRGFFGCRHFSKANQYLAAHGITPIEW